MKKKLSSIRIFILFILTQNIEKKKLLKTIKMLYIRKDSKMKEKMTYY